MVTSVMPTLIKRGYEPRVLALKDAGSATDGTGMTGKISERMRYPVDRRVWTVTP